MAIKFKVVKTGVDAKYDVTVKGYYEDGGVRVSEDKVFVFDPVSVSLDGMQDAVSKAQPVVDPEVAVKKAAADTSLAKLAAYIGTSVALYPVGTVYVDEVIKAV